jgi:hypothetical protein
LSLKSHEQSAESVKPGGKLQTKEDEATGKEQRQHDLRTVALVQDFFRKNEIPRDEILRILSIMETNAHEIPIPDGTGQITRHLIGKNLNMLSLKFIRFLYF